MDLDRVAIEMARAEAALTRLVGEEVDTLTVNSLDVEDAPFLGQIVSKLSPMIGNLLERRIIQILDEDAEHGMHWIRQDPGFPDALLVDSKHNSVEAGFEVKAWYVFSTELTGRFRESRNLLEGRDVRLVVVAWAMSHIVYGVPKVLGVLVEPAVNVAESRDTHYHKPPSYLIVEPNDTTSRTLNLQQTNVNGYKLQETGTARIEAAIQKVANSERGPLPNSPLEQELAQALMSSFSYRLDTNFAKIDRIDNDGIERFKTQILRGYFRDKQVSAWVRILRNLNSNKESDREAAAVVIQSVYDSL